MYDEDEEEKNTPRGKAQALQSEFVYPETTSTTDRAINEGLYTLNEGHAFDDNTLTDEDVWRCWALVEWAKNATPEQIEAIRL